MLVTPLPIVTLLRRVQEAKALPVIQVTLLGIT